MKNICKFDGCRNAATVKGYCRTHYSYTKVRARDKALRDVVRNISKLADELAVKNPNLANVLTDITKEAKTLYREFQQPPRPADKLSQLEAEVAELRALIKRR